MADNTKIEWTDATWNPVNGCSLASPGCTNCYAMKQAHRVPQRRGLTQHTSGGMVWTGETRFDEAKLTQPLHWKRPRRIFVCAHGDLFHESVPDEWIDRVFAVMALCPQHTFQVLTKRSARMRDYCDRKTSANGAGAIADAMAAMGGSAGQQLALMELQAEKSCLPNVWLGVSVEDQARADQRIPDLLDTPAAVRWLSCEPLLGPVDLTAIQAPRYTPEDAAMDWRFSCLDTGDYYWYRSGDYIDGGDGPWREHAIDWVVAGGESGPGARPMHPDWPRALRDQCAAANVPFFFKQWGNWAPRDMFDDVTGLAASSMLPDGTQCVHANPVSTSLVRIGKRTAGRLLDGIEHNGFPNRPSRLRDDRTEAN